MTGTTRYTSIDIAKGISIVLVALNHSKFNLYFPAFIDSMGLVRMPLFFFLAGIFINSNKSKGDYARVKASALLKPYFVVLLSLAAIHLWLPKKNLTFGGEIAGILYGVGDSIQWTSLWFLTHLFVLSLTGYLLIHFFGLAKPNKIKKICLLLLLIMGIYLTSTMYASFTFFIGGLPNVIRGLPFSIDLLPFSLTFFLSGYFLRQYILNLRANWGLFYIGLSVFLILISMTEVDIDLNQRIIVNPVLVIFAGFIGIYLILILSTVASRFAILKNFWMYFGSASMLILLFHGVILFYVDYYSNRFLYHLDIPSTNHIQLLIVCVSFVSCIIFPPLLKHSKLISTLLLTRRGS